MKLASQAHTSLQRTLYVAARVKVWLAAPTGMHLCPVRATVSSGNRRQLQRVV